MNPPLHPTEPHPLMDGCPPSWAREWGEDAYGPFVGIRVGEATQRFRWIRPGTFWMGSPDSEKGRFSDEGPRHLVTLSEGFWMAETPCTQQLWQEVVGKNPSRFQSPHRPVEKVSWELCQEFMEKLGQRVEGLGAGLPTEAQWERACRAGSEEATWLGDLEILGERNAPLLDAIAWYGGNSGVDYDLDTFHDSGIWPEKQYDHHRAGTRNVATKDPNPWGLYGMLGNVYEWCEDYFGEYSKTPTNDPSGPEKGGIRVFRGGSWFGNARRVRAAYRYWYHPGYRSDRLGFRLSLGGGRSRGAVETQDRGAVDGEGSRSER